VTVAAGVAAVGVAAALSGVLPGRQVVPGLPEAGPGVTLLLPAVKASGQLAAAVTIGWLLAAAWLVPPQRSGVLDVAGYRAVRAAARVAGIWAVLSAGLAVLTIADTAGRPVGEILAAPQRLLVAVDALATVRAALLTAAVAALIALLARTVLRPGGAAMLLGLAVVALLPQAAVGHTAQTRDHDVAVDSLVFHLVGMCVWVGGLVAVLTLAWHRSRHLDVITARYSAVALVGLVAVAVSGVVNAMVRLSGFGDLWGTGYGRLLLVKTALLLLLGGFGAWHRRRTLPAVRAGDRAGFVRLAVVEVLVMAATVGVATALARTVPPPPAPEAGEPSDAERVLGFALDGPPTLPALLTGWRMDWLLGTAAVLMALWYLIGVRRLRRRGIPWPRRRSLAWVSGCAVILLATSSGLGRYAEAQFSVHMVAHMLLGMTAPALLVLGGPVTLALRVLPPAARTGPPGAREALVAALHSRPARILTHPLVVLPLFIGSFAAVYFTPLFGVLVSSHFGHLAMNLHFLLIGYLYYWVIIGVDPAPRRLPFLAKFGMLLLPLPFHSFAGIAMMSTRVPRAADYYQSLALPWVPDLAADQRLGGAIAWAAVEGPVVIVILALVAQWAGSDARDARRADRRGHTRADAELDAYNRMLIALADRDHVRTPARGPVIASRRPARTASRRPARTDPPGPRTAGRPGRAPAADTAPPPPAPAAAPTPPAAAPPPPPTRTAP
jgi:putative copper resistance protein D